ncbi:MAG TPA: hypothetical protein VGP63_25325 [Planctomycetaceae bacterium]|jgi:hypothetical protein|nr:hypothetical protein [Planctomycetaceae bacterium]
MSDEPKKRSWVRTRWAALALFVLYPLSVGPAWGVVHAIDPKDNGCWGSVFGAIYSPLGFAAALTGTQWPLFRYMFLFERREAVPPGEPRPDEPPPPHTD